MGKPLSVDLRERVFGYFATGHSRRAAGRVFGVGASTVVRWVAGRNKTGSRAAKPAEKVKKASRDEVLALRAEVRKCEDRLAKLNDMRDNLAKKLADPALYEDARKGALETWNKKYAEVMAALDKAEAMWLAAQEKLEAAG